QSTWQRWWLLSATKLHRSIYRLSHRKWWKRPWPRLRRLPRRKTFRFQSLLRRPRFNRSLSRKEHRRRNNHKTRQNSRQSRVPDRCRCRKPKPSPYMRRGPSTLTRLVHGMSPAVEGSSAQWTQVEATAVAVGVRQALGVLSSVIPVLARFGSGDLDLEQFPRLTFPSPSP